MLNVRLLIILVKSIRNFCLFKLVFLVNLNQICGKNNQNSLQTIIEFRYFSTFIPTFVLIIRKHGVNHTIASLEYRIYIILISGDSYDTQKKKHFAR